MTQFAASKDGIRIAWEVEGEGKPIVLVHGFASSREQNWRAPGWIQRLTGAGFRVVSFDCRGHGESDNPHDPSAYGEHMIDDILAVMDASGTARADIMGYSMGGIMTIRFLMQYPGRVRRAVVAGIGENYFVQQQDWRSALAAAMLIEDPAAIADRVARRFRLFGGQKGKDRVALAACMRSPQYKYVPADLAGSQCPVLIVCGEKDDMTGAPGPLAACFADGRAVALPGKDHMTAVGDKNYKDAVIAFLNE